MKKSESKILLIKQDDNDFERYYNDLVKKNNITVLPISIFEGKKTSSFIDKIKRFSGLSLISRKTIENFEMIIVFEDAGLIPFLKIKANKNTRIVYWQWNILTESKARKLQLIRPFCELWTFDSNDAKKYRMKLNTQFYDIKDKADFSNPQNVKTAFCACVDKGRYKTLSEIRKMLMKCSVKCDFVLVKEKGIPYASEDSDWVKNKGITYKEFLKRTIQSDLVVDSVQKGQMGITVRVLEALFYNKKLITNNVAIKQFPFYSKANVFIYGYDSESEFENFLKQPYAEIPTEIKEQYTVNQWVKNFMDDNDLRKNDCDWHYRNG